MSAKASVKAATPLGKTMFKHLSACDPFKIYIWRLGSCSVSENAIILRGAAIGQICKIILRDL